MTYELCSPKLIDAVVAEVFDGPLAEAGFRRMRHRLYVRSRIQQMNDVIEFFRDRLNLNFLWGLSLNFVPHVTNGVENVRWSDAQERVQGPVLFRIWSRSGTGLDNRGY